MPYEHILTETHDKVALVTLNRPKALNALSGLLMNELADAIADLEGDDNISVIVITGNEKAFAAGADIKEMKDKTYMEAYEEDFITANWERVASCRKPVIAAVAGYALGGGCELAMMCDLVVAADNAKFGQPEITLGTIPGAGGTQRLTRVVGKSKSMDMILTGRMMEADEAERCGLVSRVFPVGELVTEALKIAAQIAEYERGTVMIAKEAVNRAYQTTLDEGIRFERRMFQSLFGTKGQREGMDAFTNKRKPRFNQA
jgi:enoyl-CoA hydratase